MSFIRRKKKRKKRVFLMGGELNPFGKYYKGYNFCKKCDKKLKVNLFSNKLVFFRLKN